MESKASQVEPKQQDQVISNDSQDGSVSNGTLLADTADDIILRANGHKPQMRRQFNWLSALGLGFSITNSWVGYLVRSLIWQYGASGVLTRAFLL